jgi:hypothetical protein
MADLITLQEYRDATGYTSVDAAFDTQVTAAIKYASSAIRNYTARDFGAPLVVEDRTYEYDGSGYVDIDDANTVNTVTLTTVGWADQVVDVALWRAMPQRRDDAPVYYYIYMPNVTAWGASPYMGFTRNVDVLAAEGRWGVQPPMVKVNAQWGWPTVPDDVKQATIWAVEDWKGTTASSAGPVTAHAIESFSESFGSRAGTGVTANALPQRALDLLANYRKFYV